MCFTILWNNKWLQAFKINKSKLKQALKHISKGFNIIEDMGLKVYSLNGTCTVVVPFDIEEHVFHTDPLEFDSRCSIAKISGTEIHPIVDAYATTCDELSDAEILNNIKYYRDSKEV